MQPSAPLTSIIPESNLLLLSQNEITSFENFRLTKINRLAH